MKRILNSLWIRYYSTRSDSAQVLMLCSLFSMSLITFRVFYTGSLLFTFLVWNLFLAFVPYMFSSFLENSPRTKRKGFFFLSGFIWLLFVPNAFYIITDLIHLDMNNGVPEWFDLALLLSFAWNGILFGIVSIRQMEKLFESHFGRRLDLLFILPVMALNGLGVFVGRFLRFNSWDIVTNPFQLIEGIVYLFIHPIQSRFDWSMVVCYTLMMTLIYLGIKKLGKVL